MQERRKVNWGIILALLIQAAAAIFAGGMLWADVDRAKKDIESYKQVPEKLSKLEGHVENIANDVREMRRWFLTR